MFCYVPGNLSLLNSSDRLGQHVLGPFPSFLLPFTVIRSGDRSLPDLAIHRGQLSLPVYQHLGVHSVPFPFYYIVFNVFHSECC